MRKTLILFWVLFTMAGISTAQNVILTGDITTDLTLTADKTYLLSGLVRVQSGAKLTIEPGDRKSVV